MTDYSESLVALRKALDTYHAAVVNELWAEALKAAEQAQRDVDKLEIFVRRRLHAKGNANVS